MDKPTAAILLTLVVHVLGIGVLFWLAFDGQGSDWRRWWPRDGGGGEPPRPAQPDGPGGAGLPLEDAAPAAARLRTEHERIGGTRRPRRPEHAPEPARVRDPA